MHKNRGDGSCVYSLTMLAQQHCFKLFFHLLSYSEQYGKVKVLVIIVIILGLDFRPIVLPASLWNTAFDGLSKEAETTI